MKRVERENYGFGPCLATKQERIAKAVFFVLFASLITLIASLLWT